MKTLLIALTMTVSASAFAGGNVQNCFTAGNVRPGEFIVKLNEGLSFNEQNQIVHQIGLLGMAIISTSQSNILLLEPADGRSDVATRDQVRIISGLQGLLDGGELDFVTCNGINRPF